MKKCILPILLASISFVNFLNAQEVKEVTFGPDNNLETQLISILGKNEDEVFFLAMKKDNVYLQRYDASTMKLNSNKELKMPSMNGIELEYENIFLMETNNLVLFATGYDKPSKTYKTYSFVVEDGVINPEGELVFSMEGEKKKRFGTIRYEVGEDDKHIAVCTYTYSKISKKEKKQVVTAILLDEEGKKLASQEIDTQKEEEITVLNLVLDYNNDIHVCLLRADYDAETKLTDRRYELLSFKKAVDYEPSSVDLMWGTSKMAGSISVVPKKDGQLVVSGFYAPTVMKKKRYPLGIKGIFFTTVSKEGVAEDMKFDDFSENYKLNFLKKKQLKKGLNIPLPYRLHYTFVNGNNETILVAESHVFDVENKMDTYAYIMAVKISPEGQLEWEQVVKKTQIYQEQTMNVGAAFMSRGLSIGFSTSITLSSDKNAYLSFTAWHTGDNLVLLFNDNAKNNGAAPDEVRKPLISAYKGVPFTATISDDKGKLKIKEEKKINDEESALQPRRSFIKDGKIYFITTKRSIEKVGVGTVAEESSK